MKPAPPPSLALRIKRQPRVNRVIWTARASGRVHESTRFLARELAGRPDSGVYRLRGTDYRCMIRHNGWDAHIVFQIFWAGVYEPPLAVQAVTTRSPRQLRILDLGGNVGLFAVWAFASLPVATVTSYEPDRLNADVLAVTLALNDLGSRWRLERSCAATEDGALPFRGGLGATSRVEAHDAELEVVPARDVLGEMDEADLVKIDIEGGEWPILADPRLASVGTRAIVLEYHPGGCPGSDPRRMARNLLEGAGFDVFEVDVGTVWAVRRPNTRTGAGSD